MEMPPMPDPEDFRDWDGYLSASAYGAALSAWERVAKYLIDKAPPSSVPAEGEKP